MTETIDIHPTTKACDPCYSGEHENCLEGPCRCYHRSDVSSMNDREEYLYSMLRTIRNALRDGKDVTSLVDNALEAFPERSQEPTMKYTVIVDANGFRDHIAGIHKAGCADIAKHPNPNAYKVDVEGTLRDALDTAVDGQDRDMGYTDDDAKVYPCAKGGR